MEVAAQGTPDLTSLTLWCTEMSPEEAGALAAGGWRLEEFQIYHNNPLFASLAASLSFALCRLVFCGCALVSSSALGAAAGWDLQDLDLMHNKALGASCISKLVASPGMAVRRLVLVRTGRARRCALAAGRAGHRAQRL
jgi:hypothetical protein